MRFEVNGESVQWNGSGDELLLDVLRDDLAIKSPKSGCAPQANCGSCCVEVDGAPQLACSFRMKRADGASINTVEGLQERVQDALATAFARFGGTQCGFCTPGIVMRAACLLKENPSPTKHDVEMALKKHICRCTGYSKIISSVIGAGALLRGEDVEFPAGAGDKVGERLVKLDAYELALGRRAYVADLNVDGMVHGVMVLSDYARANITAIDWSRCKDVEGFIDYVRAEDVPGARKIGLIVKDWPPFVGVGETTRYVGDCLGVVVCKTRKAARLAAPLVDVHYDVLDPVTDPFEAMDPLAPHVHSGGNILSKCEFKRGNAWDALRDSAHVVSHRFTTQRIEHAFLEPECAIAMPHPDHDGVRVWSQSQGVYQDRVQLAALLGVPEEQVQVILVPNGGGFGGKEDLSVQGQAAVAARKLGVPVRIELTRDESIRVHPKRHPIVMDYKVACDADGKLTVVWARMVGDTGAYASVGMKVLERAAGHSTGSYSVPNVDVEAVTVYTNNLPCGAFRGFGANQANFAIESCVDELCALGGFDRWQFRHDNALRVGSTTATGQVLEGGVGALACLDAIKPAYEANKDHCGIALGLKNTGVGNGKADEGRAKIIVRGPDDIELHHGWTDMGQGADTVAVQFFCNETGIPASHCRVVVDTDHQVVCGMTTASRATSLIGNAMIDACVGFNADRESLGLAQMIGREYRGEWICDWSTKPGDFSGKVITHYSYSYAAQCVIIGDDGRIEKVVAAHDAGRIVNPTLFEGQIEGGVHMGLGYALTEDMPCDESGWPVSTRIKDCGILPAHDTPEIEVIGVEVADPIGPFGAKGVGEIGLVPTAPAVANAFWAVDKQRRRKLPFFPLRRRPRRTRGTTLASDS